MLDTPEGRRFAAAMDWEPGRAELRIEARSACACGCGQPDRVDFTLCGRTVSIISPGAVAAAIAILQEALGKLWKEP